MGVKASFELNLEQTTSLQSKQISERQLTSENSVTVAVAAATYELLIVRVFYDRKRLPSLLGAWAWQASNFACVIELVIFKASLGRSNPRLRQWVSWLSTFV